MLDAGEVVSESPGPSSVTSLEARCPSKDKGATLVHRSDQDRKRIRVYSDKGETRFGRIQESKGDKI